MMNNYGTPPLALASGDGAVVTDVDGKSYLDLLGGIAVNILGHRHPAVIDAVTTQLNTLGHTSNLYATEPGIALAEALVGLLGADDAARVFFCNSGTEANEVAFKITRLTGRTKIVAAQGAFHGRTMGSLALTGQPSKQEPFAPLPGDVVHVPYGDVAALAEAIDDTTAAVFLEPIMGEGGVVVPPRRLSGCRSGAHDDARRSAGPRRGADRNGPHRHVLRPPARRHHARHRDPRQGTRRWAADRCLHRRRAGRRAAHTRPARQHVRRQPGLRRRGIGGACDVLADDDLISRADVLGKTLHHGIESLRHPLVDHVRGRGLLRGIVLSAPEGKTVEAAARDAGFLVNAAAPDVIRLAPPLVITEAQIAEFLTALPGVLDKAVS